MVCGHSGRASACGGGRVCIGGKNAERRAAGQYGTIQAAIFAIAQESDKTGWTIEVEEGAYERFTVLDGMDHLTVRGKGTVEIAVCNNSAAPAPVTGAYPDTAGVSIRYACGVTLEGLTLKAGTQANPWYASAVSNYTESGNKGDNLTVKNCVFEGTGDKTGVFINTGTTKFAVEGCRFQGWKEAISMYGDGTVLKGAAVTGNSFQNCAFAIHGYYGGQGGGNGGTLTFANNSVAGTDDTRCKIVFQDQINTGAFKVNVVNNALENAVVGLVNLRENGETISDVLKANTFGVNSFYVEAIEPGTLAFYTAYYAPEGKGYWQLTGKEDFEVDWGKNPDGSTALIQQKIEEANANNDHALYLTGIDKNNLIKTFTWFKDGIYWVTIKPEPTAVPGIDIPQTGDQERLGLYCGLLALASGGLVLLALRGRRKGC